MISAEPWPSSSVTNAILPRRLACTRSCVTMPATSTRSCARREVRERRARERRELRGVGRRTDGPTGRSRAPPSRASAARPRVHSRVATSDAARPARVLAEERHLRARWRCARSAASSAMPTDASSAARRGSIASNAPARTSASTARRLTTRLSTRRQKSNRSRERPARVARGDDRLDRRLARCP